MNPDSIAPFSEFRHAVDMQLRFNDIDILGHLNNTVYFSLYDTGKAHYFSSIMGGRMDWRKVETVLANVDCCYISPIYFGEEIQVMTRVMAVHEKSFRLQQVMVEKRTGEIKSAAETVMVSIDTETKRAVVIPPHWREALDRELSQVRSNK